MAKVYQMLKFVNVSTGIKTTIVIIVREEATD